jgi:hypothetical protein
VAAIEIAMIGSSGEQHVRELRRRSAAANGRHDCPLCTLGVAHLDEAPEPARDARDVGRHAGKRVEWKARRLVG